jgi:hypothetical protein
MAQPMPPGDPSPHRPSAPTSASAPPGQKPISTAQIENKNFRRYVTEDLREIGVATVGDRRKLLAAIAELAALSPSTELRPSPSPEVQISPLLLAIRFLTALKPADPRRYL